MGEGKRRSTEAKTDFKVAFAKFKPFITLSWDEWGKPHVTAAEDTIMKAKASKFEAAILRVWAGTTNKEKWTAVVDKYLDSAGDVSSHCHPVFWAKVQSVASKKK
jgi:hypothetical protein